MQWRPNHRTAAIHTRSLLEQGANQSWITAQYRQIEWTRSVRFGIRWQSIHTCALLQQQTHQRYIARKHGIMQHRAIIITRVRHRIDVRSEGEQQQYLFGAMTMTCRSH